MSDTDTADGAVVTTGRHRDRRLRPWRKYAVAVLVAVSVLVAGFGVWVAVQVIIAVFAARGAL